MFFDSTESVAYRVSGKISPMLYTIVQLFDLRDGKIFNRPDLFSVKLCSIKFCRLIVYQCRAKERDHRSARRFIKR